MGHWQISVNTAEKPSKRFHEFALNLKGKLSVLLSRRYSLRFKLYHVDSWVMLQIHLGLRR